MLYNFREDASDIDWERPMTGSLMPAVNPPNSQGSPRDLLRHRERQFQIYGTSTSNFAFAPNPLYSVFTKETVMVCLPVVRSRNMTRVSAVAKTGA